MSSSPHLSLGVKRWFQLLALSCSAALAVAGEPAPSLFRVRSATDAEGFTHRLGEDRGTKVVVLVFLGAECPISQRYLPKLNRLAADHKTNAVEFYGVVAERKMTRAKAAAFAKEYSIQFPVLFDDKLALARWLRPTHVPEAFVLKPDGDIVYRGRIDDWYESIGKARAVIQHHELRDGIAAVLAGRTPQRLFARPVGCYFEELPRQ
jgi:peroxiredoxin